MKIKEIRELTTEELLNKIEELKEELFNLRFANATGNLEKPSRIKEIRKSKGLTQEQLSEMIDIETSSLSGIESGRFYPSLHVLEKIAQVFDVELIEFFKFSTVNLPENLDEEIVKIIDKQDKKNKQLIYKLLNAAFMTIS